MLLYLYLYNKKIFVIFGILTSVFFIAENISINPYQYTWMNSFAKFYNINKNFEVDYWGISNKALSNQIKKDYKNKEFKKKKLYLWWSICGRFFTKSWLYMF